MRKELFLQTKFVKGKKILYINYYVIFINFFLHSPTLDCTFKKLLTKIFFQNFELM